MLILVSVLLGAVVGSFVGACAVRLPQGRPIAAGRSRCDRCGTALGPAELVPLLSYLRQKGRCRHCNARIGAVHVVAELGGIAVGLLAVVSGATPLGMLAWAVFGWTLLLLALLDARCFWLPDVLTLPLAALGLLAGTMVGTPVLADRLIGAIAGFLLLEGLRLGYRRLRGREGLGQGDAKLLAAIGAWMGWQALPWVVLVAALLGLVFVARGQGAGRPVGADRLPLGTFLAAAAIALMPFVPMLS